MEPLACCLGVLSKQRRDTGTCQGRINGSGLLKPTVESRFGLGRGVQYSAMIEEGIGHVNMLVFPPVQQNTVAAPVDVTNLLLLARVRRHDWESVGCGDPCNARHA